MSIDITKINNLSFEGGGGKGIVYLGAVKGLEIALEKTINKPKNEPLIDIFEEFNLKQIKRISGASAGAITAFMLSIGMNSKDIEDLTNEIHTSTFNYFGSKSNIDVSRFEKFFQDADSSLNHAVIDKKRSYIYTNFENFEKKIAVALNTFIITLKFLSDTIKDLLHKKKQKPLEIPILTRQILFNNQSHKYLASLLFNRGLFVGEDPINLFEELLNKFVIEKYIAKYGKNNLLKYTNHAKARDITFLDLFRLTNVNLVLMGVNINYGEPRYFSVYHTPNMPVVDAITISMSIPLLFKPVYIDLKMRDYSFNPEDNKQSKEEIDQHNNKYKGLYVDGGMLINFPIHAFDKLEQIKIATIKNEDGSYNYNNYLISKVKENLEYEFEETTLGLKLDTSTIRIKNDIKDVYGDGEKENENNYKILGEYFLLLLDTFMYGGSKGQINATKVEENTIRLDYGFIETTDFSSPNLDEKRGIVSPTNPLKSMKEYKQDLILNAKKLILTKLGLNE